jgi:excisionase family DNA binding protein
MQKEFDPLSDWISQAEAARLRGTTRQAVAKLVRNGRLRTIKVGGYTFVSRAEIMKFQAQPSGRRRSKQQK